MPVAADVETGDDQNISLCTFAVQTISCDNITGFISDPIIFYYSIKDNSNSIVWTEHNPNINSNTNDNGNLKVHSTHASHERYVTALSVACSLAAFLILIITVFVIVTIHLIKQLAKVQPTLGDPGTNINSHENEGRVSAENIIASENIAYASITKTHC